MKLSRTNDLYLFCDNKAAISIVHNPVQYDQTKHIEINQHFIIKEKIVDGSLSLYHVASKDQLADVFTKSFK